MIADLPPDAAQDDTEFMTRLGQFALLSDQERIAVLDARDAALADRLSRLTELSQRSASERWSTLVTAELITRTESERRWLAGLAASRRAAGMTGPPRPATRTPTSPSEPTRRGAVWTEERCLRRGKTVPRSAPASERESREGRRHLQAPRWRAGNRSPRGMSAQAQYALLAGPLLSMLDSSIVNVASRPSPGTCARACQLVQWAVSGYLLALGTGLAATAYLSRRFGTLAGLPGQRGRLHAGVRGVRRRT